MRSERAAQRSSPSDDPSDPCASINEKPQRPANRTTNRTAHEALPTPQIKSLPAANCGSQKFRLRQVVEASFTPAGHPGVDKKNPNDQLTSECTSNPSRAFDSSIRGQRTAAIMPLWVARGGPGHARSIAVP